MKQILSKTLYFEIFLIISKHHGQHEKSCINSQVHRPNEEKTKEEENERSERGNCFPQYLVKNSYLLFFKRN